MNDNRTPVGGCVKCGQQLFDDDFEQDENGYGYCPLCCKEADENEKKYQDEKRAEQRVKQLARETVDKMSVELAAKAMLNWQLKLFGMP